ncbi:peptidoglycan-binding protein [Nocardioides sp. GCM10027113]|uniref:L,D-transpeptidase family protein n=1 Tax=unclassified Nocardioides TaxID=2615069 RepID=UPI00360F9320
MKALRIALTTLVVTALLCTAAYGVGLALAYQEERSAAAAQDPDSSPGDRAVDRPGADPTPTASPEPEPEPDPEPFELRPGDRGKKVRELQSRLFQLAWFPELTTGRYDAATRDAVAGFQAKRGFRASGVTDERTWRRLVAMTQRPTRDQLLNVLHPGPRLLGAGDTGPEVRDLQARLKAIAWISGDVTGTFDPTTVAAVRGFQAKREIPVTGEVDQRTLDRLHAMTVAPTYEQMHNIVPKPGGLDPRCTTGRVLCVDKSTNSLRWVVDGRVLRTFDVRFGSDEMPTREGAFSVFAKSRDHVSSLYDTSMPFAMFFSGGQAVHYSPDFASVGYSGASHGCVNVRDYAGIAALFDEVRIGDRVVVYWS